MVSLFSRQANSKYTFAGKTAIVCGGSMGIGEATARQIVARGGSVCLVARREEPLEKAASAMKALAHVEEQFIDAIACDATDMERLEPLLDAYLERRGVPHYLINAVGYAYPNFLPDLTLADFRRNMDVNYYGQLVPILCLLPHLMQARKGHIVNVSSVLGFIGGVGYATYTPSKYAIVGLSNALRNELKPFNIKVSVAYPPDTDTPGFELENQTKPQEVAWMSSHNTKLLTADEVAAAMIRGILAGDSDILIGDARWIQPAARFLPRLVRYITAREYAAARRKFNKDHSP